MTVYKAFRGDYLEPTPPGMLDTEDISVVLFTDYQKLDLALSSIIEELEDRYDGAPDAGLQWMAELIRLAKEAKGEL